MDFLKMAQDFPALESSEGRAGKESMTYSQRESALEGIDAELDFKTRAKMAGTNLEYHAALKLVALENPHLDKQRADLQNGGRVITAGGAGPLGRLSASDLELEQVEALIGQKTQEKVRESGGALQYHDAMKLVAREHPDLDRRRTRLQGTGPGND